MGMQCAPSLPSSSSADLPVSLSLERARKKQRELETWMLSRQAMAMPLADVEREQERRNREAQRLLLQAHLDTRGTGNVGPAVRVRSGIEGHTPGLRSVDHRQDPCTVRSIFGEVSLQRTSYGRPGEDSIHPLDEDLQLPARSFTQELQRRAIVGAVQGPFDEAIERVRESTGEVLSKRSMEQIVRDAATDVNTFYSDRTLPPPETTGEIVAASADGKGVNMVKPEETLRVVRRGKGEKANKKRMATVATVFTQKPNYRTPDQVANSLFQEGPKPVADTRETSSPRHRPEHKRVWASIEKSKEEVIAEVRDEVRRRNPDGKKQVVAVTDGERALQMLMTAALVDAVVVLDFLHVLEKVWKAAYCFHAEGSEEAKAWVQEYARRLLHGQVSQVVKGIRQSATKRGLHGEKRRTIDAVTGYFYRNRRRMRYDEYLRKGFPIASGAVEGACKNLVKDRMERSGMRWTIPTAEAMLKLRAAYLSGDLEDYLRFHTKCEQHRLYPPGLWKAVEK